MDGRNLSNEIIDKWNSKMSLYDVALLIPNFIKKVLTNTNNVFYGTFNTGAVYDLNNFNNMLVNTFHCRLDQSIESDPKEINNPEGGYTLILTDDCLILFENFENNPSIGKIIFWATLYAITDVQINKNTKMVKLNFYAEEKQSSKSIRLIFGNVLFFRDALVKRMNNLKIKVEAMKNTRSENNEKRLTARDIAVMSIEEIEEEFKILRTKIENNKLSYYVINTYSILCGKAIEYYSANDDQGKQSDYLQEMKIILMRPEVQKIMNDNSSTQ